MADRPVKPFSLASTPKPDEKAQETPELDTAPLRDKDNAAPRVTPPQAVNKPAPNLAPPGMSGIKTGFTSQQRAPLPSDRQAGIALDAAELKDHETIDGRVITMPGYSFQAKMTDQQASQNIEGGRIEALSLWKDNNLVASYNKGWQRDPPGPEAKEAIHRIRNGLDDRREKEFKPLVPNQDKDQGHER